ncbi:hypothetical protein [Limosilactobacillus mucosae]
MATTTAKAGPCIGCHAYTTAGTHFMDATAKKTRLKGHNSRLRRVFKW